MVDTPRATRSRDFTVSPWSALADPDCRVRVGHCPDSVTSSMGSLVKKRRKRMRKKKHKKMLRRTRHQRRK